MTQMSLVICWHFLLTTTERRRTTFDSSWFHKLLLGFTQNNIFPLFFTNELEHLCDRVLCLTSQQDSGLQTQFQQSLSDQRAQSCI